VDANGGRDSQAPGCGSQSAGPGKLGFGKTSVYPPYPVWSAHPSPSLLINPCINPCILEGHKFRAGRKQTPPESSRAGPEGVSR
jgi:hypothetical protein